MQGWRISMEDAHAAVLDLQAEGANKDSKPAPPEKRRAYFGVYDGHGGEKVAQFAGENIHKIIAKQEGFKSGNLEQAMKDGFLATDRAILNGNMHDQAQEETLLTRPDVRYEEEVSGCTASVAILTKEKIWVVSSPLASTKLPTKIHLGKRR